MRRLSALGAATLGLVGAVLFLRRRSGPAERVDVYHEDGSMVSLALGTPQAERMLALAHQALRAARGGVE
jgi:hypothetical protein